MNRTMYGLCDKKNGNLVYVRTDSNYEKGDCCYPVRYELTFDKSDGGNIWLAEDRETAEKARTTNTEWYNAEFRTPGNPFKPEDLEVVEIDLKINKP